MKIRNRKGTVLWIVMAIIFLILIYFIWRYYDLRIQELNEEMNTNQVIVGIRYATTIGRTKIKMS